MLEELRRKLIFNLISLTLYTLLLLKGAFIGRDRYLQLQQSINTKTSKMMQLTPMLDNTPDAPSTKSNLPEQQGPGSLLQFLDILTVVHGQVEVLLLECLRTADDVDFSLQKQDLSSCARCFKTQKRSPQCLRVPLRHAMFFFLKDYRELRCWTCQDHGQSTCTYPYCDWKQKYILLTSTICVKSSHLRRLIHCFKTKVEIEISFEQFVSSSVQCYHIHYCRSRLCLCPSCQNGWIQRCSPDLERSRLNNNNLYLTQLS